MLPRRRTAGARGRQRAPRHRPAGPGVGADGDPRGVPRARDRRRPAVGRPAAAAVGAGGDAGRRPGGRRRCWPALRAGRRRAGRRRPRRRRRDDRRLLRARPRRRAGDAAAGRRSGCRPGGAPSRATSACRPASTTCGPRPRRRGWRRPGRPAALGEAAATVALRRHLRAEAAYGPGRRRRARASGSSSSPAGCSGTPSRPRWTAVVARLAADRGGAGGRAGRHRRSSSTAATCWPPPGCWPPSTRRRPPGCSADCQATRIPSSAAIPAAHPVSWAALIVQPRRSATPASRSIPSPAQVDPAVPGTLEHQRAHRAVDQPDVPQVGAGEVQLTDGAAGQGDVDQGRPAQVQEVDLDPVQADPGQPGPVRRQGTEPPAGIPTSRKVASTSDQLGLRRSVAGSWPTAPGRSRRRRVQSVSSHLEEPGARRVPVSPSPA